MVKFRHIILTPLLGSRELRNIVLSKFCSKIDRKFDVCLIASVPGTLDHIDCLKYHSCCLYVNRSASHKNFQYLGSKCWNNVPVDLRNLSDVTCFNNSYKKQLLASILTDESYVTDNSIEKFYAITIIPSN